MKRLIVAAVAVLGVLAGGSAFADAGYKKGKGLYIENQDKSFTLNMGSRIQVRFTQTDPEVGDSTGSFDIRRAKIFFKGNVYTDWKYKVQAVWSGSSTNLEDASLQYTRNKLAQLWVGQGKVLFGRQQLTSSGSQQFVDRAITDSEFVPARSQGIALLGKTDNKKFEYNVGIYDDFDGDNVRTNTDDNYMYTGRIVYTPFGEYKPNESSHDYPDSSRLALGLKTLSDTMTSGSIDTENDTLGFEVAYKIKGFNAVAEFFDRSVGVSGMSDVDTDGYYVQLAYLFPNKRFEIAGRMAEISPDVLGASMDETETGVAFSYYLDKHRYKVQGDYRMLEFDADPTLDTDEIRVQLQMIF